MGQGYTRNDTGNNIADGNIINAADLDGEFDAVEAAFNETTGHTHDGTAAEGAPITVLGPVQDFIASATEIKPKTTNTLDIGTVSLQFKDMYLDGTAYIDGLGEDILVATDKKVQFRDTALFINSSVDGQLDIDADVELEVVAPTVDIDASTAVTIDTATLTITGSANVVGDLDVDNININGNTISSTDTNGNLTIDPNGTGDIVLDANVGIGTSSPSSTLSVKTSAGTFNVEPLGAGAVQLASPTSLGFNIGSGYNYEFDVNGTEAMRIDSSGNVGIGTSSPATSYGNVLQIHDTGTSGANLRLTDSTSGAGTGNGFEIIQIGADDYIINRENGFIATYTNGSERMRIDSSGNVGIGTSSPIRTLHVDSASNLVGRFSSSATEGFIQLAGSGTSTAPRVGATVNSLIFYTNDAERLRIGSGGNVGIGTSSPNAKLQVSTSSSGAYGAIIYNTSATGEGLTIRGGSTSSQNALVVQDYNGSNALLAVQGSGNVGIGTGSPSGGVQLDVRGTGVLQLVNTDTVQLLASSGGSTLKNVSNNPLIFGTNNTERMRILSSGAVTVSGDADASPYNNSGDDPATVLNAFNLGLFSAARYNGDPAAFNRTGNDGAIVTFYQDGTAEGNINVSGSTVSLVGGHLSRWSQTSDGSKDTSIVRGTVMTNLNEMCEWKQVSFDYVITDDEGNQRIIPKKTGYGGDADVGQTVTVQFEDSDVTGTVVAEDNEQLNRMAVSSVEGDVNVAGVMDSWDEDDDNYDDMTIAMTGDFVIRIAQGTTVTRGDLLMSAGDGTAKPQGDDIVRSKTIAKVTSTHVSHTYDDGSYLVPCVLMAC